MTKSTTKLRSYLSSPNRARLI